MNRYLLNIAYIGTQFRGIQKNVSKSADPNTIQGCLELALQKLKPVNPIVTTLSSRTDAGVHALHSTVHVDLEKSNGSPYVPLNITLALNHEFSTHNLPIRIINTIHVPPEFHCRYNAIARTYLYRLATAKHEIKLNDLDDQLGNETRKLIHTAFLPIEEISRCLFLQYPNFDIEAVKETAQLFAGRHDFRTFMKTNNDSPKHMRPMYSVRTISEISITPGRPLTNIFDYEKALELYNFWDIKVTGSSFVHKQVRRIVAALIAVGSHRITTKGVYEMLTIPSKNSWNPRVVVVPGFGLYLCKVHYNEEDFKFKSSEISDTTLESSNIKNSELTSSTRLNNNYKEEIKQ